MEYVLFTWLVFNNISRFTFTAFDDRKNTII